MSRTRVVKHLNGMTEYIQKVKFQCGCINLIPTLNYKPKIDTKKLCPKCYLVNLMRG